MPDTILTSPVIKIRNIAELREALINVQSWHDPEYILSQVGRSMARGFKCEYMTTTDSSKALSLHEFHNGVLMIDALPDKYRTFAIDMLRQLIQDYNCQTAGEKATAELVAINYIRVLDIQEQLMTSLNFQRLRGYQHKPIPNDPFYGSEKNSCTACRRSNIELKMLDFLSKELDRANRHYLIAIQTLRMMKQTPLNITLKTQTAVIGQNQMVQTNNHE